MMKKKGYILFIVVWLLSCSNGQNDVVEESFILLENAKDCALDFLEKQKSQFKYKNFSYTVKKLYDGHHSFDSGFKSLITISMLNKVRVGAPYTAKKSLQVYINSIYAYCYPDKQRIYDGIVRQSSLEEIVKKNKNEPVYIKIENGKSHIWMYYR